MYQLYSPKTFFLVIFALIWPYLPLFGHIYPFMVMFDLIYPYILLYYTLYITHDDTYHNCIAVFNKMILIF